MSRKFTYRQWIRLPGNSVSIDRTYSRSYLCTLAHTAAASNAPTETGTRTGIRSPEVNRARLRNVRTGHHHPDPSHLSAQRVDSRNALAGTTPRITSRPAGPLRSPARRHPGGLPLPTHRDLPRRRLPQRCRLGIARPGHGPDLGHHPDPVDLSAQRVRLPQRPPVVPPPRITSLWLVHFAAQRDDHPGVYRSQRTVTYHDGAFHSAAAWGSPAPGHGPISVTTQTQSIYRRSASTPATPPWYTTENHVPLWLVTSQPSATTTQGVYRSRRTVTYHAGAFHSAAAWGSPVRVTAPTSSRSARSVRALDRRSEQLGQGYDYECGVLLMGCGIREHLVTAISSRTSRQADQHRAPPRGSRSGPPRSRSPMATQYGSGCDLRTARVNSLRGPAGPARLWHRGVAMARIEFRISEDGSTVAAACVPCSRRGGDAPARMVSVSTGPIPASSPGALGWSGLMERARSSRRKVT